MSSLAISNQDVSTATNINPTYSHQLEQEGPQTSPVANDTVREEVAPDVQKADAKVQPGLEHDIYNGFLLHNVAPEWDKKNTLGENIKLNYPHWFNIATVVLHALGGTLPSVSFIPKKISLGVRKLAVAFSQFCVPVSKLQNFWEAVKDKKLYEAAARLLPNLFLPFLPFHNFQLAYGLGSGINVVHEHIKSRVGGLNPRHSFDTNRKKIETGLKEAVKDLLNGGKHVSLKERAKLFLTLSGGVAMLFGAIPTLIFDRTGLNDTFARIFGTIRSLGGFLGDLSIILFPSNQNPKLRKKEPMIGGFYLLPSFMDCAQRWMKQDPETNEIFNHIKTTLNTIAELTWTHFSTLESKAAKVKAAEEAKLKPHIEQEPLRQAFKSPVGIKTQDLHLPV